MLHLHYLVNLQHYSHILRFYMLKIMVLLKLRAKQGLNYWHFLSKILKEEFKTKEDHCDLYHTPLFAFRKGQALHKFKCSQSSGTCSQETWCLLYLYNQNQEAILHKTATSLHGLKFWLILQSESLFVRTASLSNHSYRTTHLFKTSLYATLLNYYQTFRP